MVRIALLAGAWLAWPAAADVKFYPDDPIEREPPPARVEKATRRKVDDIYDLFYHTLVRPGERQRPGKTIPSQGVNTLGEVPDGAWYVNRHGRRPMATAEIVRGPGTTSAPDRSGPWRIIASKTQGITPGFRIADSKGRRYLLKFDPVTNPEMATAADVIGAKFFHALGYHVPENYVVFFRRSQLVVDPKTRFTDAFGKQRPLSEGDVDVILQDVPKSSEGVYRGVASLYLKGDPLLEFRYFGTRKDDPNDVVAHEHRRDLRGLFVFCAWLGHDDSRSINTLDTLVEEDGLRYVKHHLIDFGSVLGSASTKANPARSGYAHFFEWSSTPELFSLGLHVPRWARVRYPDLPSVGRFEANVFEPDRYKTDYPNPAFQNRLPDDEFWAARQVMAFSDNDVRALVKTGEYSDPRAEQWIADTLIARRNKIGRAYFAKVLPLDGFAVRDGRLVFDDLAVKHQFTAPREYSIAWSRLDNASGALTPFSGTGAALPPSDAEYFAADIRADDPRKSVKVYLRGASGGFKIVGIERSW